MLLGSKSFIHAAWSVLNMDTVFNYKVCKMKSSEWRVKKNFKEKYIVDFVLNV